MTARDDALAADAGDTLAPLCALFDLPPGVIYLDGNSLGALPKATAARLLDVVVRQWGRGLIGSWNGIDDDDDDDGDGDDGGGWIGWPQRVGDKIARVVGAGRGEVVVADSTSVNLHKVLGAALAIAARTSPRRVDIVSEAGNFPTDLYVAREAARRAGGELVLAADDTEVASLLNARTAVLLLTHVDYRSGRMHDLAAMSAAAHAAGALAVWDLAHSAGAVPLALVRDGADFAVGCGYKYLNGGPGAPAFVWVHPRHVDAVTPPLPGWLGHAAPFEFDADYRPAAGIARYQCGTPPVLSLAALDCGVDTLLAAEPFGGIAALRAKSLALTRRFAAAVAAHGLDLEPLTPADDARRGSQVAYRCPVDGYAVIQALIARGVVGDFRAPDILRFGFAPLYLRHVDAVDAAAALADVLASRDWQRPEFARRRTVT